MTAGDDSDPALALVERALQAIEQDGRADLAAICRDRPDLLPLVERALACRSSAAQIGGAPDGRTDALFGVRLGGRYEIGRRLGQGAMGAVYEAKDTVLGRTVAAKVLHRSLFGGEELARERFQREARAAAALRHPGIVGVHDHGGGDQPWLIMDLIAAPDLAAMIGHAAAASDSRRRGHAVHERFHATSDGAPWERSWPVLMATVIASAARAVDAAHAQGVVHRDIKPSNLLVRADLSAVVVDFGLARLAGDATLTAANLPLGSPSYMAPEQAAGERPDRASDIYALGASLYHALGLRPPFAGEPGSVLLQVQNDDPMPLQRLDRSLPRDLVVICSKAMSREPRDRYASAGELAFDLEAFVALRPIRARPLGWPRRTVRWAQRHPARAIALALACAFVPASVVATGAVVEAGERRALAAANDARRAVPALATIEGRNSAENLFRSKREDQAARAALDAVLVADPRDEEALAMRAMLHADEGRTTAALTDLRALADKRPGSAMLAAVIGSLANGDTDPAWPMLANLPPAGNALEHFLVAYWSHRAGRFDAANDALEAALRCDPEHGPSWHLRLLVLSALQRDEAVLGEASGVEQRLGGPTARTRHARGLAQARRQQWQNAADDYARCVELASPSAGTLINLAVAKRILGDFDGALSILERAAEQRPEMRRVFFERFNLLRRLGRKQEAMALAEALPRDTAVARSAREHARGLVLLADARQAHDRGTDVEPMRSEAEAALRAAMAEVTGTQRQELALELVTAEFLQHRDHQLAFDKVLELLGPEADSAAAHRAAWFHAGGAGLPRSVVRHHVERANWLEPTDRASAQKFAELLLGDEPPDAVHALSVLAKAHRTPAAWRTAAELAARALAGCLDPERFERALPAVEDAVASGLFRDTPVPESLQAAIRDFSQNLQSVPPVFSALLGR